MRPISLIFSKERRETGTEVVEILVYSSSNAGSILSSARGFYPNSIDAKCVRARYAGSISRLEELAERSASVN